MMDSTGTRGVSSWIEGKRKRQNSASYTPTWQTTAGSVVNAPRSPVPLGPRPKQVPPQRECSWHLQLSPFGWHWSQR